MEVAEKACTDEDRREFLSFADAWDKLAIEIELSERLVAFIDELSTNIDADAVLEGSEPPRRSYTQPLRQLAAAMVAISDHVASDATSASKSNARGKPVRREAGARRPCLARAG